MPRASEGVQLFSMSKSAINFSKASIWIHLPLTAVAAVSPVRSIFTSKYKSLGSLEQQWKMFVKGTGTRHHTWVEIVVGSLPCSQRFFYAYSGFPLSTKTNIFTL